MTSSAVLSPCEQFRYLLTRGTGPRMAWVCLNPSTADADFDDASSRKINRFTADFGYPGYDLGNVGAGRATDPMNWRAQPDPRGPDNDLYLAYLAQAPLVVVGWGNGAPAWLVWRTVRILRAPGRPLYCLGTNDNGSPKHPLYIPYGTALREWQPI